MNASPRAPSLHPALRLPDLLKSSAYIANRWLQSASGACFPVDNPADGTVLAEVAALSADETRAAVAAAAEAFPSWSRSLPQRRSALLMAWHDLMLAHREDLALIMTLEQGKPISEARGEIDYAASFLSWYAAEAQRQNVETVTSHLAGADMRVSRVPMGVAALVTPWNFPSAMITRKAAAALAAGCTCVAHPSRETPLSALALAELAGRAGFPTGVFNVVTGEPAEVVSALTASPDVRVLSFTGSTEIGRLLYGQCAPTIKPLVMELGGHAPFIAFADGDLERMVEHAVLAKFATSGQDCLAANRIYVERPIAEAFAERLAARVSSLSVGPGLGDPDIGPLMNAGAIAKQEVHVADALARGARLLTGGRRHAAGPLFFEPTVLADVPEAALIFREETFGPVAALTAFDTEEEVITRANDTAYGLCAYLHTGSAGRARRVSAALDFGMVAVNRTKITGGPVPFGGVRQSGLGREGSRHGMEAFMDIKYICEEAA